MAPHTGSVAQDLAMTGSSSLVISKRTFDVHVEHIYTKLGIASRVQLANWLKPCPASHLPSCG
ncbi:MAG TPA: LuxR C-terminal-related transcriptional regulator [Streptosporangiaceae bacterium]|nr:LuxR C-terminal-related transcriptional regulator [Streptosporangiaceae bacterium]